MKSMATTDLMELRRANKPNMTADEWYQVLKLAAAALDELQQAKIDQLNAACEQTILAGFTAATTGHTYSFNSYDQLNMTQQMLIVINDSTLNAIDWKTTDAGVITHTREQFLAVCQEAEQFKHSNISRYWDLKAQVLAATSSDQVDAIAWQA